MTVNRPDSSSHLLAKALTLIDEGDPRILQKRVSSGVDLEQKSSRMQAGAGLSTVKDVLHSQAPQDPEQQILREVQQCIPALPQVASLLSANVWHSRLDSDWSSCASLSIRGSILHLERKCHQLPSASETQTGESKLAESQ